MSGMLDSMIKLSTKAAPVVNRISAWLFPPCCLFCHASVPLAGCCCAACLTDIVIWPQSVCGLCGAELPALMQPGPCGRCLRKPPPQRQTYSLYRYHGPVREAILNWKLEGRSAAVRWLLDEAMPGLCERMDEHSLLLPVPMPMSRMRSRGQHHAADLCRWLARGTGSSWDWRVLRRSGEQPRQSTLSGQARRMNLRKAFILADDYTQYVSEAVQSVWIVDDILTTGSTLHFAARAAVRLAVPVHVLSLARTSFRR